MKPSDQPGSHATGILTDYHCHTTFCDGNTGPRELAERACTEGFRVLGFSVHAPIPFDNGCNMSEARMDDYIRDIRQLGTEYSGRMEVLLGWEIDWLPGLRVPGDAWWQQVEKDYCIGSLHNITAPDGVNFPVDHKHDLVAKFVADSWGGDKAAMLACYWQTLAEMIRHGNFDILGHFDLVRKNNRDLKLFDPGDPAYRRGALAAIEELAAHPAVVEINTGGMARGRTDSPYPEVWMLQEMRRHNLKICINSDSHAPDHLIPWRQTAVQTALEAGYREAWYLSQGEWKAWGLID